MDTIHLWIIPKAQLPTFASHVYQIAKNAQINLHAKNASKDSNLLLMD
jgi:hypothetical protein